MNKLKDFHKLDQLYYIEEFVNKCKNVLTKFDNEDENPESKKAENLLLNQLFK
tara:strand:+ start:676 stop:834 length:159 start_codon:yes stop_codon:yes gene_type:complete